MEKGKENERVCPGAWEVCQEMFRASPRLRGWLMAQTALLLLGRGCAAWAALAVAGAVDAGRLGEPAGAWALGAVGAFAIAKGMDWALSSLHSALHARHILPTAFDFCDKALAAALRSPRLAGLDPVEMARRMDRKAEARHFLGSIFHHIAPPAIEILICSAALSWMGFGALAWAIAPAAAAHVWLAVSMAPKARARIARALQASEASQSVAAQALEKAALARSYGSQEVLERLCAEKSAEEKRSFRLQALASDLALTAQNALLALFAVAIFGAGYAMMARGLATAGAFAALAGISASAFGQLKNLGFAFDGMITSARALSDHAAYLSEARALPAPRPVAPAPPGAFELLDWSVFRGDARVCHIARLRLEPGEKLYLVGASGAGKSSLLLSLLGMARASGSMSWGGAPWPAGEPGLCAYMPQDSASMGGSARDNLLLGKPGASDEELWGALRLAGLEERMKSAGGLAARLDWRGSNLSGGEAQRLSLARAALSGMPLLLLDEPTSGLDALSERSAIAALSAMRERSAIICAHRLRAIPKGSRVAVLDGGLLIEQGRLEELIEAGGAFATLWRASEAQS